MIIVGTIGMIVGAVTCVGSIGSAIYILTQIF